MADMPRSYQVQWAKEEVLDGIDRHINEKYQDCSYDEWLSLVDQRNRVANFLNLPARNRYASVPIPDTSGE